MKTFFCDCMKEAEIEQEIRSGNEILVTVTCAKEYDRCSFEHSYEREMTEDEAEYFMLEDCKEEARAQGLELLHELSWEIEVYMEVYTVTVNAKTKSVEVFDNQQFVYRVEVADVMKLPVAFEEVIKNTKSNCIFL